MKNSSLMEVASKICKYKGMFLVCFVGKGAFKETFHVKKDKTSYALKIIDPKTAKSERTLREIAATQKCNSPNIVSLFEADTFYIDDINYSFIIEEFLDGGTLTDRITTKTWGKEDIKYLTINLIRAIQCLKDNKLVHRDIKPDNIMFKANSDTPILVDLGLVRDLNASSITRSWVLHGPGTPFFSSPEQLNNDKALISWKSDQFSLGVVLAFILTGKHPYESINNSNDNTLQQVLSHNGPQQWFCEITKSSELNFIDKMIQPWPIRRFHTISDWLENIR